MQKLELHFSQVNEMFLFSQNLQSTIICFSPSIVQDIISYNIYENTDINYFMRPILIFLNYEKDFNFVIKIQKQLTHFFLARNFVQETQKFVKRRVT